MLSVTNRTPKQSCYLLNSWNAIILERVLNLLQDCIVNPTVCFLSNADNKTPLYVIHEKQTHIKYYCILAIKYGQIHIFFFISEGM